MVWETGTLGFDDNKKLVYIKVLANHCHALPMDGPKEKELEEVL